MRQLTLTIALLLHPSFAVAQDWRPIATDLIQREKPGFGGLSGVAVERTTGELLICLSDRGLFGSKDQGKTWTRHGPDKVKGRTETPGCLMFDPTGPNKRFIFPTVYGGPIGTGSLGSDEVRFLDPKVTHVDWCAVNWADPDMKFMLTLKHESGGVLLMSRDGGKSFTGLGKNFGSAWIFDADTAVIARMKSKELPEGGIFRTTNGGEDLQRVTNYTATALPRWHDGALYWLAGGSLMKTTDKGATWTSVGSIKDGRYGPVFGKDAKHMLVLTGAGIIESKDAGQSWSKAIAAPKDMKGIAYLTWLDYDPTRDVIYMMKMGSDLYMMAR